MDRFDWVRELKELTDDELDALLFDMGFVGSCSLMNTVCLMAESCPINFSLGLLGFLKSYKNKAPYMPPAISVCPSEWKVMLVKGSYDVITLTDFFSLMS